MDIVLPQLEQLTLHMGEPRKFIQVVAGPRQVGKSTMVGQYVMRCKVPVLHVSADESLDLSPLWIGQQWEAARAMAEESKQKEAVLVIDEIQKLDKWSERIKQYWDEDTRVKRKLKVILLGSSRLLIQRGLSESLAGRFELIQMTHWSYAHMKKAFGFTPEQYVWFGGYPGAADFIGNEKRWKEYVLHGLIEATISKDILMLTRIDKPALLKKVFEMGCAYSGLILSYTKMMGQLNDAGNTTTLASYLNILDEAGLLCGLQKYSGNAISAKGSIPKFQVYNSALSSVYSGLTFNEVQKQPALWGRAVEVAIGTHLINSCRIQNMKLHYWRERNDEVDFVLKRGKEFIPIEVKTTATNRLPGMAAFEKKFRPKKILLAGTSGISWQKFLTMNVERFFGGY